MSGVFDAALNGKTEDLKYLLGLAADATAIAAFRSNDGYTPLLAAAHNGHEECVKLLLAVGAEKGAKTNDGATPLFIAAQNGREACVYLLIAAGADMEAKKNGGFTPLHIAAHNGHDTCAKLLLEAGADKDAKDDGGATPLHVAAHNGHKACVWRLLYAGADKHTKFNGRGGATPLHIAVLGGHLECVKLLLEAGADTERGDNEGNTPLSWAAETGRLEFLKRLLDARACITVVSNAGMTPLAWAVRNGHIECAGLLRAAMKAKEAADTKAAADAKEVTSAAIATAVAKAREAAAAAAEEQTDAAVKRAVAEAAVERKRLISANRKLEDTVAMLERHLRALCAPMAGAPPAPDALPAATAHPIPVGGASKLSPLPAIPAGRVAVFLTHDWGEKDELGRNNHATVSKVNSALKNRGLTTWFDEEKMETAKQQTWLMRLPQQGVITKQMAKGIEASMTVAVFITERYLQKVNGDDFGDNCQLEFNYAQQAKTSEHMIAVPMEPRCIPPRTWKGSVGLALGCALYRANFASLDEAKFEENCDTLYEEVVSRIRKQLAVAPAASEAPPRAVAATTARTGCC